MRKTKNINFNAEYEIRLSPNTYWVPISSIGRPQFTECEAARLISSSPEKIRESIWTLYDAVQLFQLCNFEETEDNKIIHHNTLEWEFHKPGYYSVLTNRGCCASDTSWLLYILNGKYEQIGVLAFIRESGSGHSLNYIKPEGWFYFVDLLSHVAKHRKYSTPETGCLADFAKSRYNTGIFIKSKSISDFVNYYNRFCNYNGIEHLFYSFSGVETCVPVAIKKGDNDILNCFFPNYYNIEIYSNKCKKLRYTFANAPKCPNWSDFL